MSFLEEQFKLRDNPFRMTPAIRADEIVWAGFPELKARFKKRIKRSMRLSNSCLILNWGEWGSGKTHAANYFNLEEVLQELSGGLAPPYSLKITFPVTKKPVNDMFTLIIDHIDIHSLRDDFSELADELAEFINSFSSSTFISSIVKAFFDKKLDESLFKEYLYGTISNPDFKIIKKFGMLRKIEGDDDRIKVLGGLFTCLSYKQKVYSNVVIWLDEFENISLLNNVNIENINNFIRDLLDNTPNYLLVFLNFTLKELIDIGDLSHYLSEAVISRVRDRIYFEQPNMKELKAYLKELLNNDLYRIGKPLKGRPYFPFPGTAIDTVVKELGEISLRRYNEAFSILLEIAELEEIKKITSQFVLDNIEEIIGWK